MEKVVYLLGAGASYGLRDESGSMKYEAVFPHVDGTVSRIRSECANIIEGLPIVSELPDRMRFKSSQIIKRRATVGVSSPFHDKLDKLFKDLVWAQKESARHSTIDTFAKKLWLQNNWDDFNRLKRVLTAYFLLEQSSDLVDKRYDSFLASILGDNSGDFPANVSILSWNYDCQFELAYSEYVKDAGINEVEGLLHFNHKSVNSIIPYNGFNIIKINGSALYYNDENSIKIVDPFGGLDEMNKMDFVASIFADSMKNKCALSFAWEQMDDLFKNRMRSVIKDASILVVIGYSFPFFNREIDRLLFGSLPYLRKVYIQDMFPDKIEESVNNLLSFRPGGIRPKIIKIYDTKQFYLPPEL